MNARMQSARSERMIGITTPDYIHAHMATDRRQAIIKAELPKSSGYHSRRIAPTLFLVARGTAPAAIVGWGRKGG